jgi:hypothetical protein
MRSKISNNRGVAARVTTYEVKIYTIEVAILNRVRIASATK